MDASVVAAMAKWPNVPDCRGWLSLDRRGQWRLQGSVVRHAGLAEFGENLPGGLAHPALGAIALDRAADALGGREADAHEGIVVAARTRLNDDGPLRGRGGLGAGEKLAALLQSLDQGGGVRHPDTPGRT